MFSPESSFYKQCSRPTKRTIHWVVMGIGNVCATVGILAIYTHKEDVGKQHIKTWHGLIGYGTWAYGLLQSCGGTSLILGWIPKGVTPYRMKAYHATSGLVCFSLMCFSLWLGMWSNWFVRTVTGTSWYACLACPMIMSLIVMNQVTQAYLPANKIPAGPMKGNS